MASDKTWGVKVNEDLYEKVQSMIESSPLTAKEWFEKAVVLFETNSIKEGAIDYRQDLSELEAHTTRIFELVSNMVQRSIYLKESAVKELSDKVEQKDTIISDYQTKTKEANEASKLANEALKVIEKEKEVLLKQIEEVRFTNENNQALISEYKEKIDTLSGLVTKYQAFANENQQLKERFSTERERLQSQVKEVMLQNHDQQDEINELNRTAERLKEAHVIEIERVTEKKEFEKDRALLELEKEYQRKLSANHEEQNKKVKELYDEIAAIRIGYEEKIEELKTKK